jgi:hypothetical protein
MATTPGGSGARTGSPSCSRPRATGTLFVSGCVPNQGKFYDRFDAVVLLSAPADVLLDGSRPARRTATARAPDERTLRAPPPETVEPLLRATCTHELDATRPLERSSTSSRRSAAAADAVERYLELALRLGRHADDLVDSVYGWDELRARVDAEEPHRATGARRGRGRAARRRRRRPWLPAQVRALGANARKARRASASTTPRRDG